MTSRSTKDGRMDLVDTTKGGQYVLGRGFTPAQADALLTRMGGHPPSIIKRRTP